jgi:hypothetical protein
MRKNKCFSGPAALRHAGRRRSGLDRAVPRQRARPVEIRHVANPRAPVGDRVQLSALGPLSAAERSPWSGEDDQLVGAVDVTVVVRWVPGSMWHANGMTGEERLGAGGEVEALRPPARSPLFAGASNRHHLPTVGRPAPLFLPGRFAEPVLAPGALADSMPEVNKAGGPRCLPLNRGNGGWPGG